MLCEVSCLTCDYNYSYCLSCGFSQLGSYLYLYENQCLLNCPVGYYANSNGLICNTCTVGCSNCYSLDSIIVQLAIMIPVIIHIINILAGILAIQVVQMVNSFLHPFYIFVNPVVLFVSHVMVRPKIVPLLIVL